MQKIIIDATILASIYAVWLKAKAIYNEAAKIVEPLVKEAEELAKDGLIDKADRKALVMSVIGRLETSGKIKLNFISRLIISKVVDKIADKLPDFTISKEAKGLLQINR